LATQERHSRGRAKGDTCERGHTHFPSKTHRFELDPFDRQTNETLQALADGLPRRKRTDY